MNHRSPEKLFLFSFIWPCLCQMAQVYSFCYLQQQMSRGALNHIWYSFAADHYIVCCMYVLCTAHLMAKNCLYISLCHKTGICLQFQTSLKAHSAIHNSLWQDHLLHREGSSLTREKPDSNGCLSHNEEDEDNEEENEKGEDEREEE